MRNQSNSLKIRHTSNAKERLEQAHRLMGITSNLSSELEEVFNQWSNIRISDPEINKLIQMALAPSKEVWQNLQIGKDDETSTCFKNMCTDAFEYAMGNESQQLETTKGTLFGAYNGVTGYFQNVRSYKNDEAKLKSILQGGTGQIRTQKAFNICQEIVKGKVIEFNN